MAQRTADRGAELERIAAELEGWRRTPGRGRGIPEEIWRGVVALAREHGVHRVARGLGLNYESVKQRVAGCGGASKTNLPARLQFLELGRGSVGEDARWVLELSTPDGVRLTVKGASAQELRALAELILERTQ